MHNPLRPCSAEIGEKTARIERGRYEGFNLAVNSETAEDFSDNRQFGLWPRNEDHPVGLKALPLPWLQ
jgi:hypothetical protein